MISNRTGFFLKTFEKWRERVALPSLVTVADLGYGVLHNALVEAAAYVLSKNAQRSNLVEFRSLLTESDKSRLSDPRAGDRYTLPRAAFEKLPNATISYWVEPSVLSVFGEYRPLDETADVRVGLQTSDDFRFLRLWWEVPPDRVGEGRRWIPFAKGGGYAPYYADLHLVVDWEDDGRRLEEWGRGRVQNTEFYFRPGLTWSRRTASAFALRALPAKSIFADKGCFVGVSEPAKIMSWANSRVTRYLIELQLAAGETTSSGGAARSYEVGIVASLPLPDDLPQSLGGLASRIAEGNARMDATSETNHQFISWQSDARSWPADVGELLDAAKAADELVADCYSLGREGRRAVDEDMGPAPGSYPKDVEIDRERFRDLIQMSIGDLVNHAIDELGGGRYLATKSFTVDRRLELMSHLFRAHPTVIDTVEQEEAILPPDVEGRHWRALISYLVGAVFGRWDVRRFGDDVDVWDPWRPLPPTSPGMLSGGGSNRETPDDYPIEVKDDGVLVDDPGSKWDLSTRVRLCAEQLNLVGEVDTALRFLGYSNLRAYLQREFFSDHVSMYSQSRRYAPIYWQLSVPSGDWSAWVYLHALDRESLFGIARAAEARLRDAKERAARIRGSDASLSREDRQTAEAQESLVSELGPFLEHARRLSNSGWSPNLDDGAILIAAPFEPLFQDRSWLGKVSREREALENGEYPWAAVQRDYFGVEA